VKNFRWTYSKKEISVIIQEYMCENETSSFKCICSYIFNKAKREDRIKKRKIPSMMAVSKFHILMKILLANYYGRRYGIKDYSSTSKRIHTSFIQMIFNLSK